MKLILACLAMLGVAQAAYHPDTCGPLQRLMVKTQWVQAFDFAEHREELDTEIFNEMLSRHPEWRHDYFERVRGEDVHSPEFRAHMARILGAFDMAITLLDDSAILTEVIEHLGHQHYEMNIPPEHFDVFREAVMHGVEHHIGHCFNYDAWNLCLHELLDGIQNVIKADAAAAAAAA